MSIPVERVAMAFILRKRENRPQVLVAPRLVEPFINTYSGAGGKLDEGETPKQAVTREIHEEAGLYIFEHQLIPLIQGAAILSGIDNIYEIHPFACWLRLRNGVPRRREPNKLGDWKWVNTDELLNLISYHNFGTVKFSANWIRTMATLVQVAYRFDPKNELLLDDLRYLEGRVPAWSTFV